MAIQNNLIAVAYKLYVHETDDDDEELVEECSEREPYSFITNLGAVLPAFEQQLGGLNAGDRFDFVIPCADAYGDFQDELMFDVPRSMFDRNGRFDEKNIFPGAIVPLQDEDGQRYNAMVIELKHDAVTIDLNHPRAGQDLHFRGKVIQNRPATPQEITTLINIMSGQGCGGCGGCQGGGCQGGGCGGC